MTEFDRIKKVCEETLTTFCGSEDAESPLDAFEINILSDALAQALTKGTPNENKS